MITCVIFVLGAIFYGIFATAEIQPWAVPKIVFLPEAPLEIEHDLKKNESSKL